MSEAMELKEAVDDLGRAWESFKAENDNGRKADQEKLDRINGAIDKAADRVDTLETRMNRTGHGVLRVADRDGTGSGLRIRCPIVSKHN